MKLLLVDDDPAFCDAASYALEREGFALSVAAEATEALRRWQHERPDVLLVDISLPGLSGLEICRRIRKVADTPIIIVSGSADERDVLRAFACGADDYVTKPFSVRELTMRIRAVSGRVHARAYSSDTSEIHLGEVILDREAHQVRCGSARVQLTPLEFRILDVLAANSGRVVSFGRLVELAWGFSGGTLVSLRHHISNLRRKLDELPGRPLFVDVVYGAGYALHLSSATADRPCETIGT